jgi:hypothetical protein
MAVAADTTAVAAKSSSIRDAPISATFLDETFNLAVGQRSKTHGQPSDRQIRVRCPADGQSRRELFHNRTPQEHHASCDEQRNGRTGIRAAASEYKLAVKRGRDALDTRHQHNSRQRIEHAAEHSITGECARRELAKGPRRSGAPNCLFSVRKLCRSKFSV